MELTEETGVPVSYTNTETLLKKFDIPVSHLDFDYVDKCNNGRTLEKILQILQSGEEGHYPDLMRRTEEKLNVVKPNSRYIRKQTPVVDFASLNEEEKVDLVQELDSWRREVQEQNKDLNEHKKIRSATHTLPEVRKRVDLEASHDKEERRRRIKSTDYASWDKYDPDTEILKMDLETERVRKQATQTKETIEDVKIVEFVTTTEATTAAIREREKGNEFYRSKDYEQAVICYSNSIRFQPTLANHSNRAQAYMKLKKYEEAAEDCKAALEFDPNDPKANYRLLVCLDSMQCFEDALPYAEKVIHVDPNNIMAQNYMNKITAITSQPVLPKTRMKIVELSEEEEEPVPIISNETEKSREVLLPIPGPSTMPEPYYIVVDNEDPELVRQQEFMINNKPHTMFCTTIDEDDFDCLEIHPTSEERQSLANVTNKELAVTEVAEKIVGVGYEKENYQAPVDCEPINKHLNQQAMENHEVQQAYVNGEQQVNAPACLTLCHGEQMYYLETNEQTGEHLFDKYPGEDVLAVPVEPEHHKQCVHHKCPDIAEEVILATGSPTAVYIVDQPCVGYSHEGTLQETDNVEMAKEEQLYEEGEYHDAWYDYATESAMEGDTANYVYVGTEDELSFSEPNTGLLPNVPKLNEPFNFQRMWLMVKNDRQYMHQAALLQKLDVSRIRQIIGLKLDTAMLADMLSTLYVHFMVPHMVERLHAVLTHLPDLARFGIIVMFLRPSDRDTIKSLFDFLEQQGMPLPAKVKKCYS